MASILRDPAEPAADHVTGALQREPGHATLTGRLGPRRGGRPPSTAEPPPRSGSATAGADPLDDPFGLELGPTTEGPLDDPFAMHLVGQPVGGEAAAPPTEPGLNDRGGVVPPVHSETPQGSRASRIDWGATPGTFSLAAEKGMEDKALLAIFETKFAQQLAASFGAGATLEHLQLLLAAARGGPSGEGDPQEVARINEGLWRAKEYAVIETLQVDRSTRYRRDAKGTYCNVYAYDVVTALGAYLPRVWWRDTGPIESGKVAVVSVPELRAKQQETGIKDPAGLGVVAPILGETTYEVNANGLADWFNQWGRSFGWDRTADVAQAQRAANSGHVVVIVAANARAPHGHISVVIAEVATHEAPSELMDDQAGPPMPTSAMTVPLQSQAGHDNFKYGANGAWWKRAEMRSEVQRDQTGTSVIDQATGKPIDAGNVWIYSGPQLDTAITRGTPDAAAGEGGTGPRPRGETAAGLAIAPR